MMDNNEEKKQTKKQPPHQLKKTVESKPEIMFPPNGILTTYIHLIFSRMSITAKWFA